MHIRRVIHRLVAILAVAVVVCCVSAREAAAEQVSVERPVRIVLAPNSFRAYAALEAEDFDYGLADRLRAGVRRYLANHPETFDVMTAAEVREQVIAQPVFGGTRSVAEEWGKIGTNSYKHLRTSEAIRQLENAVEKFASIDYAVIDPKRVSELLMYLSLSYLNQGDNAARPLVLMKRMIRLDPSRLLRRGFYPDKIANFYASARQDLLRRLREEGPEVSRAKRLVELTGADLVVFGNAFPKGDGSHDATLRVYSEKSGEFLEAQTLTVGELTPRSARGAANRLMSRMAPCIYQKPEPSGEVDTIVDSTGEGPLSIHLNFAYASFLRYPEAIEKPFGNLGVGLGADVLLTEEFGISASVQVLRSQPDYSGRIVDEFSTVRTIVGPDLGIDVGIFNFGLSVGLEGTHVSRFAVCEDLNVPAQEMGCPDANDRKVYDDMGFLLGVNARPRIRVDLFDSFALLVAGGYTFYFVPFAAQPLNNPIAGEAGIQYRF